MNHLKTFSYTTVLPGEGLKHLVSHFWHSQWKTGRQESFNYHSTANSNTEIVFAFEPGRQPVFTSLQGHTGTHCCIRSGGLSELFGVALYSHAIPYFFNASAGELADQLIDLSEVMRPDIEAITHQLALAHDFYKRVEIMSRYLQATLNTNRKTDGIILHALQKIRKRQGQVTIDKLATEHALSQKQFERRFKNYTGFNPKLYAGICRFQNALWPFKEHTRLIDKALDLGYYDQAHFINDFRKFSGFSPGQYTPITT